MLTKAYITSLPNKGDTLFKVRVPLYEDNTGTPAIFDAYLCITPGINNGYKVGDTVYVNFEDNQQDVCIILGKLYYGTDSSDDAYVYASDLKVTNTATLPADTKLGSYSVEDFTKLYNSVLIGGANGSSSGGGASSYDVEQLKKKINFTDWVIEQPTVTDSEGNKIPGPNLNFYRKFKGE